MIPRYSRPEMARIWEPENRFRIWFEIEAHACDAQAALGIIPASAARAVWERGAFEIERIDQIERETRHDVIAFLTNLAEHIGPEARFLHQGMTSSDVLDTALAVQLKEAADLLLADLDGLLALKRRAFEHKYTPTIGRSHGIHAEPTSFGVKLAGFYAEFDRARARLALAKEEISTCAISGAVGTFANVPPAIEEYVASKLGLRPEPVSTQVIPRDRHAILRDLGRDREFGRAPGARNPPFATHRAARGRRIFRARAEGLVGDAAQAQPRAVGELDRPRAARARDGHPALENVALWHERDISHSAVERVIAPDADDRGSTSPSRA